MDIETAAESLQRSLEEHKNFRHLRVKKRGQSLTIFSGKPEDPWPHARLSRKSSTSNLWQLSFPDHKGRWERTPFFGSLRELTVMLARDFSFLMRDFDSFTPRK
jgi:hypothetical protein